MSGKARRAADVLKQGLRGLEGGGAQPGANLSGTGEFKRREGGDPSNPKSPEDLVLASVAGYRGSFEALGLKIGPGPDGRQTVLGADGKPAPPEALEALRRRIAGEPKALMRRPDFYSVLPRERMMDLKQAYRSDSAGAQGPFRHIGLTSGDRDFAFSESCQALSGDCNDHVSSSYKKGEFVEPESLAEIDKAVADEKPASKEKEESGWDGGEGDWATRDFDGARESPPPAGFGKRFRAKLDEAAAGLRDLAGFRPEEPAEAFAGGAPGSVAGPGRPSAAPRRGPSREGVGALERSAAESGSRSRRGAAAGAVLLAIAAAWLARRRFS